jgi:3-oxoacyl-[acyl-carrier protein] reductase
MPASLAGRCALVTGGSRGIGRAVAIELAACGAAVVVGYHSDHQAAQETVAAITQAGGQALAQAADMADEGQATNLVEFAARSFGDIQILVCNAGIVTGNLTALQTTEEWQRILAVNLTGPFFCIRAAIPYMMAAGGGNIICMSSLAATRAVRGLAGYSASKGGLEAMVRSLAVELGKKRIRVNGVAPGLIETEMLAGLQERLVGENAGRVALGRLGKPQEVARVVRFLVSDEASYISGEVVAVSGGLGM